MRHFHVRFNGFIMKIHITEHTKGMSFTGRDFDIKSNVIWTILISNYTRCNHNANHNNLHFHTALKFRRWCANRICIREIPTESRDQSRTKALPFSERMTYKKHQNPKRITVKKRLVKGYWSLQQSVKVTNKLYVWNSLLFYINMTLIAVVTYLISLRL